MSLRKQCEEMLHSVALCDCVIVWCVVHADLAGGSSRPSNRAMARSCDDANASPCSSTSIAPAAAAAGCCCCCVCVCCACCWPSCCCCCCFLCARIATDCRCATMISAHNTLLRSVPRLLLVPHVPPAAAAVGGPMAAASLLSAAFSRPELAERWDPDAAWCDTHSSTAQHSPGYHNTGQGRTGQQVASSRLCIASKCGWTRGKIAVGPAAADAPVHCVPLSWRHACSWCISAAAIAGAWHLGQFHRQCTYMHAMRLWCASPLLLSTGP